MGACFLLFRRANTAQEPRSATGLSGALLVQASNRWRGACDWIYSFVSSRPIALSCKQAHREGGVVVAACFCVRCHFLSLAAACFAVCASGGTSCSSAFARACAGGGALAFLLILVAVPGVIWASLPGSGGGGSRLQLRRWVQALIGDPLAWSFCPCS